MSTYDVWIESDPQYRKVKAERHRYLALLKEIATNPPTCNPIEAWNGSERVMLQGVPTVASIQRHVRQQLEKWGVKIND